MFQHWQTFALASAVFAALTALFAKVGVNSLNSNLATLIRTVVIFFVTALIVTMRGEWEKPDTLDARSVGFLVLSGIATALSWLCYFHALRLGPVSGVAPVDKVSVVLAMGLAFIFLGEPVTLQALGGGLLILCGSLLIATA